MLETYNFRALTVNSGDIKLELAWLFLGAKTKRLHELQCHCKYFQAQAGRCNRKNPSKFLGCQYCHKVSMQNEVV